MTEKQKEIIKNNLRAFENNFGKVKIEKYGKDFYVYFPIDNPEYIQRCSSIEYLNGWLYGCVQGVLRVQYLAEDRSLVDRLFEVMRNDLGLMAEHKDEDSLLAELKSSSSEVLRMYEDMYLKE